MAAQLNLFARGRPATHIDTLGVVPPGPAMHDAGQILIEGQRCTRFATDQAGISRTRAGDSLREVANEGFEELL
ncbi:MAG: hypothetical protein Cons2KO_14600 [Congregibacter sp.]